MQLIISINCGVTGFSLGLGIFRRVSIFLFQLFGALVVGIVGKGCKGFFEATTESVKNSHNCSPYALAVAGLLPSHQHSEVVSSHHFAHFFFLASSDLIRTSPLFVWHAFMLDAGVQDTMGVDQSIPKRSYG